MRMAVAAFVYLLAFQTAELLNAGLSLDLSYPLRQCSFRMISCPAPANGCLQFVEIPQLAGWQWHVGLGHEGGVRLPIDKSEDDACSSLLLVSTLWFPTIDVAPLAGLQLRFRS